LLPCANRGGIFSRSLRFSSVRVFLFIARPVFYGAIWACFATGGIVAALILLKRGTAALWLPIGGLIALMVYDLASPLTTSASVPQADRSENAD